MHKVLSQSIAAELKQVRSAPDSSGVMAAGGPTLSTTAKVLSIPIGADWVSITPRNFVACGTVRVALTPRLTIVITTNLLTTPGVHDDGVEPTALSAYGTQDISDEMQDGDAEDFAVDSFDTIANSNALYVGSHEKFRGAHVDVGTGPNGTATTLTVKYPTGSGDTWADISATDGTDTGAILAQDGNVTWTVPTAWQKRSLVSLGDTAISEPWATAELYWTRWEVDTAIDSDTDIRQIRALADTTKYAELTEGQPLEFAVNTRRVANVEALTDAGTANVVVNAGILETSITGRKQAFREA